MIQLFGEFSLQVKQEISHGTHIFGLLLITTKLSVHYDVLMQVPLYKIKNIRKIIKINTILI